MGVNMRNVVDPDVLKGVRIRHLDGARTWKSWTDTEGASVRRATRDLRRAPGRTVREYSVASARLGRESVSGSQ